VSRSYRKIIRNRKARIERRLSRNLGFGTQPLLGTSNIHYEMGEKSQGMSYGGIGAIHLMAGRVGLMRDINRQVPLLKLNLPYWESDHVLNIAYNVLLGGVRLEDIELRRNDEVYLNALNVERIPDPTTSGDFTRRFGANHVVALMEAINTSRRRVWKKRGRKLLKDACIDVDGTLAGTYGECKEGMDISRKGIWGYHPLIVSLANTKEVLYMVNRPGNVVSHQGSAEWIDKAIELVQPYARRITVRGDTDFYLTKHLDRWAQIVDFVFGADASPALVQRAEDLPEACYRRLKRKPKYTVKSTRRRRPKNIKEKIVEQREFENLRLESEHVAEFRYQPTNCKRQYRVVVVRKNISREKGEAVLIPEIRYFFYITTREELTASQVVEQANGRCDQENVIEQLKNGVNALRMPVDNLLSNWAYMVMAALAWNLKAWFAMMVRFKDRQVELLRMEFRRFLHAMVLLPVQIVRQGRKIIYRLLGYNAWLRNFFSAWEFVRRARFA